jgi:hypothetical protein
MQCSSYVILIYCLVPSSSYVILIYCLVPSSSYVILIYCLVPSSLKQSQIYYVASKIIQVFFINFFCSGFEDWRENKSFKISLSWNCIVLSHWNNSPRVDMSLHSDTLFWFQANQSFLFLLNAASLAVCSRLSNKMVVTP